MPETVLRVICLRSRRAALRQARANAVWKASGVTHKKGRPETGRHNKLKMYSAGLGRNRTKVTSLLHAFGAVRLPACNPLHQSNARLQDSGHSGRVLRGVTHNPSLSHASGMAVRPRCLLTSHLRAYRNGTVGMLLHLVLKGERITISGKRVQKWRRFAPNALGLRQIYPAGS